MSHPAIEQKDCVLHFKSTSSRFAVRNVLSELTDGLTGFGLPADCLCTVELVAAEALNNVIEHAFQFQDGMPFEIRAEFRGNEIEIQIIDHGHPMPGLSLPDTATGKAGAPAVDVESANLPEGGWGWFLIRDLTKQLSYRRVDTHNHLVMVMDA